MVDALDIELTTAVPVALCPRTISLRAAMAAISTFDSRAV